MYLGKAGRLRIISFVVSKKGAKIRHGTYIGRAKKLRSRRNLAFFNYEKLRYTFSTNNKVHKSSCGHVAPDPLIDRLSKIYQLKGLEPKNKGHTNFYECCDLTKKYI